MSRADFLNSWIAPILTAAQTNGWTPVIYISVDLATDEGLFSGQTTAVDETLPSGSVEVRNSAEVAAPWDPEEIWTAGMVMASYSGASMRAGS